MIKDERISGGNIEATMEGYVKSRYFNRCAKEDIREISKRYKWWRTSRDREVDKYLTKQKQHQVADNILEKFDALHEREQLLTYFSNLNEIKWNMQNYRETNEQKLVEDEYVEAPGERNVKRAVKKRK